MGCQVRQGDVLLVRTSLIGRRTDLRASRIVPPVNGRVILAYGEVTGHAHAVEAGLAELFEAHDGARYLDVRDVAELCHEEHAAVTLEPGVYMIVLQREFRGGVVRAAGD